MVFNLKLNIANYNLVLKRLIWYRLVKEHAKTKIGKTALDETLEAAKPVLQIVFIFAFMVNLCMLITPLYSLQVLDRVLSSQSIETLLYLTLIMTLVYIALHLMQVARSFTLIKLGEWLDAKLSPALFMKNISLAAISPAAGSAGQYLRDLQAVKGFLTSAGINAIFDAPWSIIYIAVLFMIHPWMGWLSIIGAVLVIFFALLNAYATNPKLSESTEFSMKSYSQAEIASRNAEVIEAMGMSRNVMKNWHKFQQASLDLQSVASYRNGILSNISRFLRMVLQMLVTGVGAYLVIVDPTHMSMGGMIGSSIILGRALAPFDSAIELWKQVAGAIKSYARLKAVFAEQSERQESMKLPTPSGILSVENVFYVPHAIARTLQPGVQPRYTVKGINFSVDAGEILAIIGPSAAGKSSLAKLIVGVWKPAQGNVRLDGADVYTWARDDFGKHIGYLPQDVELFAGTIKDNIARMDLEADPMKVVEAAQFAGAHEMILRLPNGYETEIGVGGSNLSGGQRQRVGLARAFYGDPKLVILDEPNANLDEIGEQALVQAVTNAKKKKITTVIISHRPSILTIVDKILIVQDGSVAAFGSRDEVMARFSKPVASPEENKKLGKENE